MTTVSVVIGTYGPEHWERLANRAARSVVGQSELIQSHLPDGTLAQARNAGAVQAHGDWLLFLDADDELAPGYIDAMAAAAAGLEGKNLLTPAIRYMRRHTRAETAKAPMFWPEIDIKTGNWMVIGTMVPRDTFLAAGGFREYEWSEDWVLWARCMELGATPVKVPDAIYIARVTPGSRNRSRSRREMLYWHQRIGYDNWPDHYASPTPDEDQSHALSTPALRFA